MAVRLEEPPILAFEEFEPYFQSNKQRLRYDSGSEPKEHHEWWTTDQAHFLQGLKAISTATTDVMAGFPEDDIEVRHLLRIGLELYKTKQSSGGRACTNAIVRYVYYASTSGSKVTATVKFHDLKHIEEIVQQHSKDYNHFYHFDEVAVASGEDTTTMKVRHHDQADVRAKDTAQDIFGTLFREKDHFLAAWSPDRFEDAPLPSELSDKIKPFLTKVDGEISLWPLVDEVKYGLDREILKLGFEFIDLPGWGDRNFAKTKHADDIKDKVDIEMTFVDTSRITTEDISINNAISDEELSKFRGHTYDYTTDKMLWLERELEQADDDGDEDRQRDRGRAAPPRKPVPPNKKTPYVEPKLRFQKRRLVASFVKPVNFYDKAMKVFHAAVEKRVGEVIDKGIGRIDGVLEGFNQRLENLVPIEYDLTPQGENIRESLHIMLPRLREEAQELQNLLPPEAIKIDDDEDSNPTADSMDLTLNIGKFARAPTQSKKLASKRSVVKKEKEVKKEDEEEEPLFTLDGPPAKRARLE
ncbi:hypothetical protein EJ04DRAFT_522443 [Polyplosphaeria fusca]|uniref:Uncharacterized protein n=1 Tax=Polyplosphaeria fusca TaxID=682080 RepID=A0A9P4R2U2_9PLEO|nr:hypothetical protein EJ04DRAFT_522443 [Polyplosphaeria fusca]